MTRLSFSEKCAASGGDGTSHEGAFIAAPKTGGTFCRPSCRAGKPKPGDLISYDSVQEALQNGFWPCKICKPMEPPGGTPGYISGIIEELRQNPYLRLKDQDLRNRGVQPGRIRNWFKKQHNITFHGYQRMLRINHAYDGIQKGRTVTDSAFDRGCDSLSSFMQGHASVFGQPPAGAAPMAVLNIVRFTTPLGPMFAVASQKGVCLLEFTDRRMLETEFRDLRKRLKAVILPGPNPHLDQAQAEMQEYFGGYRQEFTVPLHYPGTDFQRSVWELLLALPYGKTRSYKEQAALLGRPGAIRAVGSANGHNRISIIIPCHRVIGSDGGLTGYGGGLHRKKWLLDFEKTHAGAK